ncbi:hypothetical protein [Pacificoceanicola onchidii]|uniref:hypothetical protein n=1 Tax=Pacificoceanicola onchidii TaxID=2562685 RepID=UPI0010A5552A|nr:hypothetical protein [Pacificoceanicola onchidii]
MTVQRGGNTPDVKGTMAAEYVLGLLDEAERAAFEAQLRVDADLEQDVAAWRTYFATFADDLEEIPPPPQLWRRIEAAAFGGEKRKPLWQILWPYAAGAVLASACTFAAFYFDLLTFAPTP